MFGKEWRNREKYKQEKKDKVKNHQAVEEDHEGEEVEDIFHAVEEVEERA